MHEWAFKIRANMQVSLIADYNQDSTHHDTAFSIGEKQFTREEKKCMALYSTVYINLFIFKLKEKNPSGMRFDNFTSLLQYQRCLTISLKHAPNIHLLRAVGVTTLWRAV